MSQYERIIGSEVHGWYVGPSPPATPKGFVALTSLMWSAARGGSAASGVELDISMVTEGFLRSGSKGSTRENSPCIPDCKNIPVMYP